MRSRKEPRPAGVINPGLEPIPILTPTTPTPATNEQVKRSVKLRISDSSGQVKRNGGKHRSSSVQIKKESKASVGTVQAQLAEKKAAYLGLLSPCLMACHWTAMIFYVISRANT